MKVIIIKKCKDGNIDDIVDVSDGYAKNFLIKNGFAIPVNEKTTKIRNTNIKEKEMIAQAKLNNALNAKKIIEGLELSFELKVTNNYVHGSITRKQIVNSLKDKGVKIDSHNIENVKISSIGITNVKVNLHKDVIAIIRVRVKESGK